MESQLISFPLGTKMFQSPKFLTLNGFSEKSHSGISGSMAACASPEPIVACHALLQCLEPSPPPNGLVEAIYFALPLHGIIEYDF